MTGDGSNKRYKNTIVRTQGWRQLFAGLSINYIKVNPIQSFQFSKCFNKRIAPKNLNLFPLICVCVC